MKTIRYNLLLLLALVSTGSFAQTKTLDKSYNTNSDVEININSSHTNVVVDYWDKNEVKVEALLDTEDMDEASRKKLTEGWKPEIEAFKDKVNIKSEAFMLSWNGDMKIPNAPLARLPEMMEPLMNDLVAPLLANISRHPLPPEFSENMGNLKFDYEAYRKDGDAYMEKFEKQIEANFGDDFEKSMEEWASQFEKDTVVWKNFELKMEDWGEDFGKDMEAWGEEFGKSMEAWGESFGKEMETHARQFESEMERAEAGKAKANAAASKVMILKNKEGGAKKTIKLSVPKNAKLKLDVRHGDVKLSGNTNNLKANLSHSRFTANNITGKNTDVKVAYTPVKVKTWDYGVLNASYVKDFRIEKARSIKLNSNSSDVVFQEIGETGILTGSFGKLKIGKLQPGFKTLDVSLENSEMELSLPNSAYNFNYNGTKSKIKAPAALSVKSTNSYDNESLNGYNKSRDAGASVNIKASFSEVLLN